MDDHFKFIALNLNSESNARTPYISGTVHAPTL